jgi:hypothetical protein
VGSLEGVSESVEEVEFPAGVVRKVVWPLVSRADSWMNFVVVGAMSSLGELVATRLLGTMPAAAPVVAIALMPVPGPVVTVIGVKLESVRTKICENAGRPCWKDQRGLPPYDRRRGLTVLGREPMAMRA